MATNNAPWWDAQFSRIDNLGGFEPESPPPGSNGFYVKPDSNIELPPGYPIQAISPGTVTSVQNTGWGQTVVTIKLDSPINSLATHQFYEHMSSTSVSPGVHVNQGDLIGYNNEGSPPLGFGFYSGDVYGSGSAWETLQSDLMAHGNSSQLSPVSFLDQMSGVNPAINNGTGFFSGLGISAQILQALPGGIASVPVIMGILIVVAIGLGTFLIYKELQ